MSTPSIARALRFSILLAAIGFAERPRPAHAAEPVPEAEAPSVRIPWAQPSGRGLGLGLDNGLWANQFASSLRIRLPFSRNWGMNVRGIGVHGVSDGPYTLTGIGSLEVFGCTPVYLNVLRIYGGGGPRVAYRLVDPGGDVAVGGGGHAGLEAFIHPSMSFTFEIGGTTGPKDLSGATAMAGVSFYL